MVGEIAPVHLDSVYPHTQLEAALRHMGGGNHLGKIIIDIALASSSLPSSQSLTDTAKVSDFNHP